MLLVSFCQPSSLYSFFNDRPSTVLRTDSIVFRLLLVLLRFSFSSLVSPITFSVIAQCGRLRGTVSAVERTVNTLLSYPSHFTAVIGCIQEPAGQGVAVRCLLSLYGIIYVTWYTSHLTNLPESDCNSFRHTRSRDYHVYNRTPIRHALLGIQNGPFVSEQSINKTLYNL